MVLRDASASKNTASLKMSRLTGRRILFCKTSSGEILSSTSSAAETSHSLYKAQTLTCVYVYKFRFRPRPKIFQFQVCILTNLEVDWQVIKKSSLVQCAYSSNFLKHIHLHKDHKYYPLNTLGWQSWNFRGAKCQKYETRSRIVDWTIFSGEYRELLLK